VFFLFLLIFLPLFHLPQDISLAHAATIEFPPAVVAYTAVGACAVALEAADGQQLSAVAADQVCGLPLLFVASSHRAR
jgi:hypothetical protein